MLWLSNTQLERREMMLKRRKHTGFKDKLGAMMSGRYEGKTFFDKGKKDVSSCCDFIPGC